MEEYLYLFIGPESDPNATQEEIDANLMEWKDWVDRLKAGGNYVKGNPLNDGSRRVTGKSAPITDGPFVESKEMIVGYMVIVADSLDHAAELARGCPIYQYKGVIDVRSIQDLPM